MSYTGSCHCGAVAFTVEAELPTQAIECNCSHCRRKGLLLTFVPAGQFSLDQGEEELRDYRFNTMKIRHRFCTTCGCQPFAEGIAPDGQDTRSINLRCVPDCDLGALERQQVDGASR